MTGIMFRAQNNSIPVKQSAGRAAWQPCADKCFGLMPETSASIVLRQDREETGLSFYNRLHVGLNKGLSQHS